VTGYRVHGQWRPVAWLLTGLALALFATFFVHDHLGHVWEPIFAIAGSLALVRAHYLNHQCKKCEHEHTHHEEEVSDAEVSSKPDGLKLTEPKNLSH
jgi:hypothetical protein